MIDGTMGADGEGPFAPTRIGSVPVLELLDYLETHSMDDVRRMCSRSGGFVSLFGTSNSDTVHALVEQGDRKAVLVWNTMIYQICKSIGAMSAVLCGKVVVYPGEMEQEAMAFPVLKVLRGKAAAMTYSGKNVWQGFGDIDL